MIRTLTPLKATLAASTALVAVGVVLVVPETRSLLAPPREQVVAPERPDLRKAPAEAEVAATQAEDAATAPAEPAAAKRADADLASGSAPVAGPGGQPPADAMLAAPPAPPPPGGNRALIEPAQPAPAPGGYAGYAPPPAEIAPLPQPDTEAYANAAPNPVKVAAEEPVSTFSIDVDTASWAVVRSSLTAGSLPPPDAVRVEEMVNYFPYAYPAPEGDAAFRPTVTVMPTPWNPDTELVHIALQGARPATDDRPPLNLVFLIDTSGSMNDAAKLPLLVQSFRLMLNELGPEDQVAIVTYAGSAGEVLPPTRAGDRETILAALGRLSAGGSTAGQEGLELAYSVARRMATEGEVSRILLATDGDFNVGVSDPEGLTAYVARKRDEGVYLSVLGFGRGNLDDATMQALAQNGNGTAAYIDTLNEARKVLVDELTGALFPIADDVKIQVEWNPATVAEYRLIGYETRALRREDFNNDKVDAGEIGAGVQVTALYEVTPVGSPAILNDALRYGQPAPARGDAGELGFLRLRWKAPGADSSQLIETPIPVASAAGGDDQRFAAAIAGMGQLLRGGTYLGDWGWDDAIQLAAGARGEDAFGYRTEAVQLMRLAQSLSGG